MNRALRRISNLARTRWLILGFGLVVTMGFAHAVDVVEEEKLSKYEQAKKDAEDEDKLLIYAFLGRSWDTPSQNMIKNVLATRLFNDAIRDSFVFVEVEVPVDPKEAETEVTMLMLEYRIANVPALVVTKASGKKVKQVDYTLDPVQKYVREFKTIEKRFAPKKK